MKTYIKSSILFIAFAVIFDAVLLREKFLLDLADWEEFGRAYPNIGIIVFAYVIIVAAIYSLSYFFLYRQLSIFSYNKKAKLILALFYFIFISGSMFFLAIFGMGIVAQSIVSDSSFYRAIQLFGAYIHDTVFIFFVCGIVFGINLLVKLRKNHSSLLSPAVMINSIAVFVPVWSILIIFLFVTILHFFKKLIIFDLVFWAKGFSIFGIGAMLLFILSSFFTRKLVEQNTDLTK